MKMKKYKKIYIITYLLLILLIITRGSKIGIQWSDYIDHGIVDGFSGGSRLLVVNILIIIAIFASSLIITLKKNNRLKYKWLIFTSIVILLLFVPTFIVYRSGGIAGISMQEYTNIVNMSIGESSIVRKLIMTIIK